MTVVHDGTLTGTGVAGDPLKVANPFTVLDETKLDGVEEGVEVNVQPDVAEAGSASDAYIRNRALLDVTINLLYQPAGGTLAGSSAWSSSRPRLCISSATVSGGSSRRRSASTSACRPWSASRPKSAGTATT